MKTLPVLAGLLLFGTVAAQDPATTEPAKVQSASERMDELQEMQQKAIKEWRDARKNAQAPTDGKPMPAIRMRPDFGPIADKALAHAKDFAGKDEAIDFLMMVVNLDQKKAKGAIETLVSAHVDSPKLSDMGPMMPYLDRIVDADFAEMAMGKLMKSKAPAVRGWALFTKHASVIESADREGDEYKDARSKLMAVAEEAGDDALASQIRGAIDEREKLGVGCEAPDIAGVDLDGVAFKLSDYKGKVIFLDFWGDW
ncbi:MAG: hypothetical protein AB8H80_14570 [Planctomycetota bacterium]